MRLLSFALIGLAVSSLTDFSLRAQVGQLSVPPASVAQIRTVKAIERQKNAVAKMAASIALQQLSIGRRARIPSSGFFGTQPSGTFVAAMAAPRCDSLPSAAIDRLVNTASERTSVAPELIRSVMWQESAFRDCAVSRKAPWA